MKITQKQLLKRIVDWQQELDVLGIAFWRLDSVEIVDSDDFWAAVNASGQYDRFRLRFDREFLGEATERELDETIVHELVHVAMRDLDAATERGLAFAPGGEDGECGNSVKHAREALVHRLSVYIVALHYGD